MSVAQVFSGQGARVFQQHAGQPADFRNEFSWSLSRERVFRECARKYYYTHYGMWGGWRASSDRRTREIYILKNLKSRTMWVGMVVHDALRRSIRLLRNGQAVLPVDEIVRITLLRMRADWVASRRGQNRIDPKRRLGLIEHEYDVPVASDVWRATAARVESCLRGFYASPLFAALAAVPPERWLDTSATRNFTLTAGDETIRVWLQPDCAYRREDGSVVIANWRTGRAGAGPEDHRVQLAGHALYAMQAWNVAPSGVQLIDLALPEARVTRLTASGADIEAARAFIAGSARDMRGLLFDSARNAARESDFQRTPDRSRCLFCPYRRVCRKPAVAVPGPAEPTATAAAARARLAAG